MKKLFYIGAAGFVLSGMLLDTRIWWLALIGVLGFLALAAYAYQHLDISDLEPMAVQQKKEANRQRTFTEWITSVEMKMP
jgi:hypothetical protein